MYYDLNVPWPRQFDAAESSSKAASKKGKKEAREASASKQDVDPLRALSPIQREKMRAVTVDVGELGYHTIAFNHVVESKFDPVRHRNPFASAIQPTHSRPPFAELELGQGRGVKGGDVKVRQLSRMTLILDEDSIGKGGHGLTAPSSSALLSYDLLSAQAFNDASFSLLCLTLSELKPSSIDIISLDLSSSARLPFFLKRSTVNAALANGVVFEICYSSILNGAEGEQNQSRVRRNVISAARDVLRVTNGKGVIFSSGAADVLGLRGPQDVINLAAIFGMNQAAAKDAISSTCRSLVLRAETRKTFRGAVSEPTIVAATPLVHRSGGDGEGKGKRKHTGGPADAPPKRAKA